MFEPDLSSEGFLADPYPTYARLRAERPICRHSGGYTILTRHAEVYEVLRSPELFSSSPMGGVAPYLDAEGSLRFARGSFIGSDPPDHGRQRKIVAEPYTARSVEPLAPRAQAITDELFAAFIDRGELELIEQLAAPLLARLGAELLGISYAKYEELRAKTKTEMRPERLRENLASLREMAAQTAALIEAKRACPMSDPISAMIEAERAGALSREELYASTGLLLDAGSEEGPFLIGNAILALLERPALLARVRAEPELIPALIEETLRYDTSVQTVMRRVQSDTVLGGHELESGTVLILFLGSANRDAASIERPDDFDLGRGSNKHLGLGHGAHTCIGLNIARLAARVAIRAVLERLDALRIAPGGLDRHLSLTTRGPAHLRLLFTRCG